MNEPVEVHRSKPLPDPRPIGDEAVTARAYDVEPHLVAGQVIGIADVLGGHRLAMYDGENDSGTDTMKASELIAALETLIAEHGDKAIALLECDTFAVKPLASDEIGFDDSEGCFVLGGSD